MEGEPTPGAVIIQPGTSRHWTTDEDGVAHIEIDTHVLGKIGIAASHPDARITGAEFDRDEVADGDSLAFDLQRFDTVDDPTYTFKDPGRPDNRGTTEFCAHCHQTINTDWSASIHAQSASNPWVQDIYAGTAAAWSDEAGCSAAGGQWMTGIGPGTAAPADRCYLGDGALPDLNDDCGDVTPCDGVATSTGQCADCHAPGIDGELGGRDLLEATGISHESGVHCDVCHKVESVDLDDPNPGVAGRLHILRLTSDGPSPIDNVLIFGPLADVLNPSMGGVPREHFANGQICAGCHEHHQEVLVPGASLDATRWPEGRLPIHTTWSELVDGPLGTDIPCGSCHMPPDPTVGNAADLGNIFAWLEPGITAGWYRTPGEVRHHTWPGPRSETTDMLGLAASISLEATLDAGTLQVSATTHNRGPAHAIPTGEPLRSLILLVTATCEGVALEPSGGDVVPDFGGVLDSRSFDEGWESWPAAQVGERIRVLHEDGSFVDYTGTGPFGDGRFDAQAKGMPRQTWAGEATITAVGPAGELTLSIPLPDGQVAHRVAPASMPTEDGAAATWAGAPGWAFARVLADEDGQRMVPHHKATDVVSDNRILPQDSWTSSHSFVASCAAPEVSAVLLHRPVPRHLSLERGWVALDKVMATGLLTVAAP
jgi:hypothetical protein